VREKKRPPLYIMRVAVCQLQLKIKRRSFTMNDIRSLSHTKWNCKYHKVFAPKYRREVFFEEKRLETGGILRELCRWKEVNIIEAEVCPDHVHMLVEIPPKMSVSRLNRPRRNISKDISKE